VIARALAVALIAAAPAAAAGPITALDAGLRPTVLQPGQAVPRWSIAERMAHHKVPGVAVAVLKNGVVVQAAGYGVRETGTTDAVDADTVFSVGSVSKVVAAATAVRLASQSRLDLDRDVNGYLKTWHVPKPPAGGEPFVTMRMLLSHTSGLGVHGFDDYLPDEAVPTLVQTLAGEKPAKNPKVTFKAAPGTTYDYSGGGYEVAELVLETVAGTLFESVAREAVFKPAGMPRSTYVSPLPASHGNIAKAHDEAGKLVAAPRGWQTFPQAAAAGLWTSANDLGAFVGVLIRSYQGKDAFLPRAAAVRMLNEVAPGGHGLGPRLAGDGVARIFHHGGANDSYRAWIEGYPETGDGVVILTNGANGTVLAREIRNALSDAIGLGVNPPVHTIALADGPSADYAGTYKRDAAVPADVRRALSDTIETNTLAVRIERGALAIVAAGEEAPWTTLPVTPSRFVTSGGATTFEFQRDTRGVVRGMVVVTEGSRDYFRKEVPALRTVSFANMHVVPFARAPL
jgi:CubicO group peptidase (beta-lactamase class C family)